MWDGVFDNRAVPNEFPTDEDVGGNWREVVVAGGQLDGCWLKLFGSCFMLVHEGIVRRLLGVIEQLYP